MSPPFETKALNSHRETITTILWSFVLHIHTRGLQPQGVILTSIPEEAQTYLCENNQINKQGSLYKSFQMEELSKF